MRRAFILAAVLLASAARAAAQDPAQSYATRRLTFGGEVTAIAGPKDDDAFFNYTDYEGNALRLARVRVFGEWRVTSAISFVGEVRTENARGLEAPAWYVRWRPWVAHDFTVQAGRIPPVAGAFARRAYGRDNAVIGLPLAYQYLTSLRPDALPATVDDLLRMRARGWQPSYPIGSSSVETGIPLLSSTKWDTGVEAQWRRGPFDLSGGVTRGAPAVPVITETNGGLQWSGRVAVQLPAGFTAGVSAARAQWIEDGVLALVPATLHGASTQSLLATDVEYGWGRWLMRGEAMRSRFELPIIGAADATATLTAWSAFVEARYRPHPRWQLGARVERLDFGTITGTFVTAPWDAGVDRVEAIVGFRVTRSFDIRGGWQRDWRSGGRVRERAFPALQVIYGF